MKQTENKYLFGAKLSFLNGKEKMVKIVEHSGTILEGTVTNYTKGGYGEKGEVIKPGAGITNAKGQYTVALDEIAQLFYN